MDLPAHRLETTLQQDGTLTIDHLPFRAGQVVEVIVLPLARRDGSDNPYPLRGLPVHYDRPTEPIADNDWETLS
jgi:hypothetical protein